MGIKEKDIVLYNNTFVRVVFLWRTKAVIMEGTRIFEVPKKHLTALNPDVIAETFEFLLNDFRFVA